MEKYILMEKIGKGTHGTVYLLKSKKEKKYVVCKSVLNKYKSHAYREILILSKLNHRRITKLIDTVIFKESIYIMLEYINHGSLESMISFFSTNSTIAHPSIGWDVMSQIGEALNYIHTKKIIHRDIKPANILVSKFHVKNKEFLEFKLCDFSLAIKSNEPMKGGHMVGTPFYMAPEMVNKESYGYSIDCWGLGCCVYELLNLKKPFQGIARGDLFNEIRTREISEEITNDKSLSLLVRSCLEKNARISSHEIMRNEKIRYILAMQELKYKDNQIEELQRKLSDIIKEGKLV